MAQSTLASRVVPAEPEPKAVAAPVPNGGRDRGEHGERDEALALLIGRDPEVSPEEKILAGLIAAELPLATRLEKVKELLGDKLLANIDAPKHAFALAKILREVILCSTAISKRVQHASSALATLRAQRHLLQQQTWRRGVDGD